jgi:hypothetical protein
MDAVNWTEVSYFGGGAGMQAVFGPDSRVIALGITDQGRGQIKLARLVDGQWKTSTVLLDRGVSEANPDLADTSFDMTFSDGGESLGVHFTTWEREPSLPGWRGDFACFDIKHDSLRWSESMTQVFTGDTRQLQDFGRTSGFASDVRFSPDATRMYLRSGSLILAFETSRGSYIGRVRLPGDAVSGQFALDANGERILYVDANPSSERLLRSFPLAE